MESDGIDKRPFGRSGQEVTSVGLGGEGILRTYGQTEGAQSVIQEALGRGIAYFDSARAYAGSETYYGSIWKQRPEARARVFQASKSASRDKRGALADLEQTLNNMGVDYLDLWQIHDVRTDRDLQAISAAGGALEAFLEAKETGRVKWISVTGHHDPRILSRAIEQWPVDAVMMPVNPVEGVLGGFLDDTLPRARDKGLAVIAMKILGASHYLHPQLGVEADALIRYALSQQGVSVAIVGCASPQEVQTLAAVGRAFRPMPPDEQHVLIDRFQPFAERLAYYRGVIRGPLI